MNSQIYPAVVALIVGAGIGVLLFVPFVAVQYRRRGGLTIGQTLLWGGFLVYGLALWTYTLLPMPQPSEIFCVGAQLHPLQFLTDIGDYPSSTPGELLRNPAVRQVVLNVALFAPLGFFLRAVGRRGIIVTTIAGFAISLAIELTQLTGVWGIYECAYRFFDVDDLIANTTGALLGGILSLVLMPFLQRSRAAHSGPRPVTRWRRVLGMICDAMMVWLVGAATAAVVQGYRALAFDADLTNTDLADDLAVLVPLVGFGLVTLLTGRTLGDMTVMIRWEGGVRPTVLRNLLRYLSGIGGWQILLAWTPGLDAVLVPVSLIAVIVMSNRGGIPALVSRAEPVDAGAAAH